MATSNTNWKSKLGKWKLSSSPSQSPHEKPPAAANRPEIDNRKSEIGNCLAWYLGASQSDIAFLEADNIDWQNRVLTYSRKKTGQVAHVRFGDELESVLRPLPKDGPLFPSFRRYRACDRATQFKKRCQQLGINGVTLHSYRYAWAERARTLGYPERFAQEALGHNSKAVHRAYAKNAKVVLPALDDYKDPKTLSIPQVDATS